jgi:hypothetical protein
VASAIRRRTGVNGVEIELAASDLEEMTGALVGKFAAN